MNIIFCININGADRIVCRRRGIKLRRNTAVLLRAAVAVSSLKAEEDIIDGLLRYSMQEHENFDVDVDIAKIRTDLDSFERQLPKYDVAFLDAFFLSGASGRLSALYQKNPYCQMILVGSKIEMVLNYLEIRPGGFLRICEQSSFDGKDCLFRQCSSVIRNLAGNNEIYQVVTKKGVYAVLLKDILYCQSDLKYINIVTKSGTRFRRLGKLSQLMEELPERFVRIHQSFIVNKELVRGIDKGTHELILEGDIRVPYSGAYRTAAAGLFAR